MYIVINCQNGQITPHSFATLGEAITYSKEQFDMLWNSGFHLENSYTEYTAYFSNPMNTNEKVQHTLDEYQHWYAWRMVKSVSVLKNVYDSYCCIISVPNTL